MTKFQPERPALCGKNDNKAEYKVLAISQTKSDCVRQIPHRTHAVKTHLCSSWCMLPLGSLLLLCTTSLLAWLRLLLPWSCSWVSIRWWSGCRTSRRLHCSWSTQFWWTDGTIGRRWWKRLANISVTVTPYDILLFKSTMFHSPQKNSIWHSFAPYCTSDVIQK